MEFYKLIFCTYAVSEAAKKAENTAYSLLLVFFILHIKRKINVLFTYYTCVSCFAAAIF